MVQSGQWLGWRPRLLSSGLSAGELPTEAAAASRNHYNQNETIEKTVKKNLGEVSVRVRGGE